MVTLRQTTEQLCCAVDVSTCFSSPHFPFSYNNKGFDLINSTEHHTSPYLVQYVQHLYLTGSLTEPDTHRMNGDGYLASTIYMAYQAGGAEAAKEVIADAIRLRPELEVAIPKWHFYSPDEVLAFEPPKFLIPGMIAEGELNLLFGLPGAGKSFVSLDLALQVAQTRKVIYLAGEGKSSYSLRYRGWMKHYAREAGDILFTPHPVDLTNPDDVGQFIEAVQVLEPTLIVIDTLANCSVGLNENDTPSMSQAVAACRRIIREVKTAILLVHHSGWEGKHERGSNVLRADVFAAAMVSQSKGTIKVSPAKIRDGIAFEPYELRVESGDNYSVLVPVEKTEQEKAMDARELGKLQILHYLAELDEEGAIQADIVRDCDLSLGHAQNCLEELATEGLIQRMTITKQRKPYIITSAGSDFLAASADIPVAA